MGSPFLTIVVPAYNEAKRIRSSLEQLIRFSETRTYPCEILIVVEKSSDGTLRIAQDMLKGRPAFQVVDNQVHRGKGYAVKSGMLKAQGELIVFMDLDLSTPLDEIGPFLEKMHKDPSMGILIGNRRHPETEIVRRQSLVRQTMGRIFNWFVQRIAIRGIRDTQCGFKMFRKHTVRPIFQRQKTDRFSFDVEVLLLAQELGFKIADSPVRWKNEGESKVNIITDSIRMLVDLFRVKRLVQSTLMTYRDPAEVEIPVSEKEAA